MGGVLFSKLLESIVYVFKIVEEMSVAQSYCLFRFSSLPYWKSEKRFLMWSTSLLLIVPQILFASDASVVFYRLLVLVLTITSGNAVSVFLSFFLFFLCFFFISNMEQTANFQEQREVLQGGSF